MQSFKASISFKILSNRTDPKCLSSMLNSDIIFYLSIIIITTTARIANRVLTLRCYSLGVTILNTIFLFIFIF